MLESSARHSFLFPAGVAEAMGYFGALGRVLGYMPHIELGDEQPTAADGYRLVYRTREMGVYDVLVVCDVRLVVDEAAGVLKLEPAVWPDLPVVEAAVKPDRTVATGNFSLEGVFRPEGKQTAVALSVSIVSELPTGEVPRFVPLNRIFKLVGRVAQKRLEESLVVFGREAVVGWGKGRA